MDELCKYEVTTLGPRGVIRMGVYAASLAEAERAIAYFGAKPRRDSVTGVATVYSRATGRKVFLGADAGLFERGLLTAWTRDDEEWAE